ncbi:MAG: ABC transporter ATP-binding protein [Bdellovibrionia bacterium]
MDGRRDSNESLPSHVRFDSYKEMTKISTAISPLKVMHLTKKYRLSTGNFFEAVSDVSFDVKAGECFGLLGPNGAGKSTSIQCITGFYPVTSGQVLIQGHDVHVVPKLARQHLGVSPQEDTLDSDFSVFDQLVRHATFFRVDATEGRIRAQELLHRFGLEEKAKQPVESLSGGMRRRLQVARALVSKPKVLVLDEPTTGLDPDARRSLWEVLTQCRTDGIAILLSTHYMDEAERLCDRIAIIDRGKILDIESPSDLIAKYISQPVIEEYIRPGTVWTRPPNLEDVYLKLTGSKLGVNGL